jgi:hypothetical protein
MLSLKPKIFLRYKIKVLRQGLKQRYNANP